MEGLPLAFGLAQSMEDFLFPVVFSNAEESEKGLREGSGARTKKALYDEVIVNRGLDTFDLSA